MQRGHLQDPDEEIPKALEATLPLHYGHLIYFFQTKKNSEYKEKRLIQTCQAVSDGLMSPHQLRVSLH